MKTPLLRIFPKCLVLLLFSFSAIGQTLPVGTLHLEEYQRRKQLRGESNLLNSFAVRPIYVANSNGFFLDSANHIIDSNKTVVLRDNVRFNLLPLIIKQQYNSHHPFGWNDGSIIPSKGYQSQLSFGLYSKIGLLSVQIQPEFVFAQNKNFPTYGAIHNDSLLKEYYNHYYNSIDEPEKFGTGSYTKIFPGQSSLRLNYKKLSVGVSSENLWWGPAIRNSLIMSNNAPSFLHLTFNTTAPILSPIGSFEGQLIGGLLKESGFLSSDTGRTYNGHKFFEPKRNEDRYLNGMVITWQPKWTKGLFLGFSRVFYLYRSDIKHSLNGYLPVISSFFKANTQNEDSLKRDQMLSLFFRLTLPKEKAEIYAEFGKNDHAQDLRDLLLEFEHARAYIMGVRKLFPLKNSKEFELLFELAQLQQPPTARLRSMGSWYAHNLVKHGYTNYGQVIGAGIGSGGSSQTISLNWIKGLNQYGVAFERVVRKNDFYYDVFEPLRNFSSHWVDLSVNLNNSWNYKRIIYKADLSLVKSLNYQWVQYSDVVNLHARLSASYLF